MNLKLKSRPLDGGKISRNVCEAENYEVNKSLIFQDHVMNDECSGNLVV